MKIEARFLLWWTLVFVGLYLLAVVFSVARAQQTPTCTLTAEPPTVLGQAQVVVTWSSTGATNCVASGGWSGPKECSGTQTLTVSQSRTFVLTAKANQGKVTARWTKPTQNEDGSPATIKGYQFFIADAPTGLPSATALDLPATPLEYVFWRTPGDVSAGIKAVRSDGVESKLSNIFSKNVTAAQATCQDSVTVNPRPKAPTLTLSWLKEILGLHDKKQDDPT